MDALNRRSTTFHGPDAYNYVHAKILWSGNLKLSGTRSSPKGSQDRDSPQNWPEKDTLSKTTFDRGMPRKLVWLEESSTAPTGKSFDEMMQNFELQRDKAFASHVCTDHPKSTGPKRSI